MLQPSAHSRSAAEPVYRVWPRADDRSAGLATILASCLADGEPVAVGSYFPDTLDAFVAVLDEAGVRCVLNPGVIDHERVPLFDLNRRLTAATGDRGARPDGPRPVLHVLDLHPHPDQTADLRAATRRRPGLRVIQHAALDEPPFTLTGGGLRDATAMLKALRVPGSRVIDHPAIGRVIQRAQTRLVKRGMDRGADAASLNEWCSRYVPDC